LIEELSPNFFVTSSSHIVLTIAITAGLLCSSPMLCGFFDQAIFQATPNNALIVFLYTCKNI
jgi:hypothetical protein